MIRGVERALRAFGRSSVTDTSKDDKHLCIGIRDSRTNLVQHLVVVLMLEYTHSDAEKTR